MVTYGNGATIGMTQLKQTLLWLARLRRLTAAVSAVVAVGAASPTSVLLLTGTTTTRTSATTIWASAFVVPPSNTYKKSGFMALGACVSREQSNKTGSKKINKNDRFTKAGQDDLLFLCYNIFIRQF